MIKRIFVASCVLVLSFGLYLPQLAASSSMGILGQSPEPYNPEFTQLVDGQNVEHVRKGPEGFVGNDGVNDRAIWGYQKDGFDNGDDFGFKISQKGIKVQDATDDQLIMSSAFNMFKVIATGELTLSACPPSSIVTDSVNLGPISTTVPTYDAYLNNVSNFVKLPYYAITGSAPYVLSAYQIDATISGGNIFFNVTTVNNDTFFTIASSTVRYYMFKETAE